MDEAVAAARFRTALELHEFGVALMLQNLRRRMKGATEEQILEAHRRWLQSDDRNDLPPEVRAFEDLLPQTATGSETLP